MTDETLLDPTVPNGQLWYMAPCYASLFSATPAVLSKVVTRVRESLPALTKEERAAAVRLVDDMLELMDRVGARR